MKKTHRKVMAIVLCVVLCVGLCVPVLAEEYSSDTNSGGSIATVTATPDSLSTGEAAEVTVTVTFGEAIECSGFNADVSVPSGWSTNANSVKATLSNDDDQKAGYNSDQNTIAKALGKEFGNDGNEYALLTGFKIKYTVAGEAAAGNQTVGLTNLEIKKVGLDTAYKWENATTSVNINAKPGYTVTLSSDAPSTGVAKGDEFHVNLDVTNSDNTVTGFNAFYGILTYDSEKVSYAGADSIGEFDVDKSTVGTLIISRANKTVSLISDKAELKLPFTATAAGDASLALTETEQSVKIDVAGNAEIQNAPKATVSGSPLSVNILETYTITFAGGDGATGTAPTIEQNPVTAGTEITLPANTFTKEGYTFSKWNDGTTDYEAGRTYTVNSDVTFTATWTKDPVVPVVININGDTDSDQPSFTGSGEQTQYQEIAVTIDQTGFIPTYNGAEMYLVEGYAENTYYYVIPASETYDKAKLGYKEGTPTTIKKAGPDNKPGYDVNQTGLVDINDAQFVYNIYNDGAEPSANKVVRLILADTDRNQIINTNDCATVVSGI